MCDLLYIIILYSFLPYRYLTTTYGSGQDIDERIVEGITITKYCMHHMGVV